MYSKDSAPYVSYTSVKKFLKVNKKTNWQTNNNNKKKHNKLD